MKYKNNVLLISGNAVSKMGNNIQKIALNTWLITVSRNASLLGWINAVTYIPLLLLNFVAGYLADNKNKKRVIVITDFISAVVCLIFALCVNVSKIYIPLILIVNLTLSICHAMFSPSLRALIPAIVSRETLKKTNAILTNLSELIKIIAPALTAYLLTLDFITIKTLFIINSISFLISSISEMFIDYTYNKSDKKSSFKDLFVNIKEGFYYLKSHTTIFKLIIFAMITNLFLSGYDVLLPYYSNVVLNDEKLYGIALSFEAAGAIIASLAVYLSKNKEVDPVDIIKTTIPQALSLLIAAISHPYALMLSVFLFGYFLAKFNVLFFSYLQLYCDEKYLGRVFAVNFTLVGILIPVGNIAFGYISEILSNYTFIIISAGILISSILLIRKK